MIRRHTTALRAALMAADFLGAVALFVIISIARYGPTWQEAWHRLGGDPWLAAAAFGAGWVVLVWFGGLYRVRARWSLRSEAIGLLRATAVLLVATITLLFVIKVSDPGRAGARDREARGRWAARRNPRTTRTPARAAACSAATGPERSSRCRTAATGSGSRRPARAELT